MNDKLEFLMVQIGLKLKLVAVVFLNLIRIYGVAIDLTNSNPASAVTYADDAVGMKLAEDVAWII